MKFKSTGIFPLSCSSFLTKKSTALTVTALYGTISIYLSHDDRYYCGILRCCYCHSCSVSISFKLLSFSWLSVKREALFPPFHKNGKLQFVSLNNFHVGGDKQRRQHFAKLYTRARFVCHSPNRDLYLSLPCPINSIGFILSRDQSANFVSEHKRVDVSSI